MQRGIGVENRIFFECPVNLPSQFLKSPNYVHATRHPCVRHSSTVTAISGRNSYLTSTMTYLRVSVWLFLAATGTCYQYDKDPADDKAGEILRKFLWNYMALVLLCEEIAIKGKVTRE